MLYLFAFCFLFKKFYFWCLCSWQECKATRVVNVEVWGEVSRTNASNFFSLFFWGVRHKRRRGLLPVAKLHQYLGMGMSTWCHLRNSMWKRMFWEYCLISFASSMTLLVSLHHCWENPSKVHWLAESTLAHLLTQTLAARRAVQPVLLSIFLHGTQCPLQAQMNWSLCSPLCIWDNVHYIDTSSGKDPVAVHAFWFFHVLDNVVAQPNLVYLLLWHSIGGHCDQALPGRPSSPSLHVCW